MATGHFSGKWMASAAPPGNIGSEYVIGSALKCPQFECIEGQTYTHICSLLCRFNKSIFNKCLKLILVINCVIFWEKNAFQIWKQIALNFYYGKALKS